MATDATARWTRRRALAALVGALVPAYACGAQGQGAPSVAPGVVPRRVAAAWDDARGGHHVGLLSLAPGRVVVHASIEVPTRAHALVAAPGGAILAVARRPGDWMLRWCPQDASRAETVQWCWADQDARLNGHVLVDRDGSCLWTTETDLETGAGQLVRRDRASMAALARWPTQGVDPHDLLQLPDGRLLLANGGITTQSETGRARRPDAPVDSSLVLLSPTDGRVQRVWRADDVQLSMRHLAWHPSGRVAVAMQAHHADALQRIQAPVLAMLDLLHGSELAIVPGSRGLSGYAGDVTVVGGQWFVSCPRADAVLRVSLDGRLTDTLGLDAACPLAGSLDQTWGWAGGRTAAMPLGVMGDLAPLTMSLDNHAAAV